MKHLFYLTAGLIGALLVGCHPLKDEVETTTTPTDPNQLYDVQVRVYASKQQLPYVIPQIRVVMGKDTTSYDLSTLSQVAIDSTGVDVRVDYKLTLSRGLVTDLYCKDCTAFLVPLRMKRGQQFVVLLTYKSLLKTPQTGEIDLLCGIQTVSKDLYFSGQDSGIEVMNIDLSKIDSFVQTYHPSYTIEAR